MNCTSCEAALPLRARFCPSCGVQVRLPEDPTFDEPAMQAVERGDERERRTASAPRDHEALKARLIDCYVNFSMSRELSEWLQELGLPSTGTMEEKLARLRQHAGLLVLPAESLSRQTIWYLNRYDEPILTEICQELGIDHNGPKERLITRVYHAVGLQEGWLQPLSEDARKVIAETFLPILRAVDHRNYDDFDEWGELGNILDRENRNQPVAQGHGSAFMAVLIPGFLQEAHGALLQDELKNRAGETGVTNKVEVVTSVRGA
ncbi:MAG: zinc ribbon domain-containing protein [Nitrospirota bacterium]